MGWEATWLSKEFHELPHMNWHLDLVKDNFDWESDEYVTSLKIIGLLVVILLLIPTIAFLLWKLITSNTVSIDKCPCKLQPVLTKILYVAAGLILFAIFCELMIHRSISKVSQLSVSNRLLDIEDHVMDHLFHTTTADMKFGRPYKDYYYNEYKMAWNFYTKHRSRLLPYLSIYGKFVTDVLRTNSKLQNPSGESTREFETALHTTLKKHDIQRFGFCIAAWIIGLILALALPHRFAIVALIGLIWCYIMIFYLIVFMVALSDFCQDPMSLVVRYTNPQNIRAKMSENLVEMCKEFNYLLTLVQPELEKKFKTYELIFKGHLQNVEADYPPSKKHWEYYRDNDVRYRLLSKVYMNYFDKVKKEKVVEDYVKNISKLECEQTPIKDEFIQKEDFKPICRRDNLLKWAFMQFLVVIMVLIIYMLLLVFIHSSLLLPVGYYVSVIKSALKRKYPETEIPHCGYPVCQKATICPCKKRNNKEIVDIVKEKKIEKAETPGKPSSTDSDIIAQRIDEKYHAGETCYPYDAYK